MVLHSGYPLPESGLQTLLPGMSSTGIFSLYARLTYTSLCSFLAGGSTGEVGHRLREGGVTLLLERTKRERRSIKGPSKFRFRPNDAVIDQP
jgi:hypothetical protein